MKRFSMVSLTLLAAVSSVSAAELVLPPVLYLSTIEGSELFDKLKQSPSFAAIDKENIGTPLRLIVSYKLQPTAGGTAAGLTSAILAGGSLGILPVVTNNDLVVTYELRVHGQPVAKQEYRENFTQAQNMYSNPQGGLDKASMAWVVSTADRFVVDIASDSKVRALVDEYQFYFGS